MSGFEAAALIGFAILLAYGCSLYAGAYQRR